MRTRGQRAERGPAPARQRAAGVIPLRRTPDGWRLLVLRAYRNWDFPKGLLQPDESPLEAALREAREEAGLVDLRFPWGTEGYQTAPYGRGKVADLLPRRDQPGAGRALAKPRTRPAGAPRGALGELRAGSGAVAPTPAAGPALGAGRGWGPRAERRQRAGASRAWGSRRAAAALASGNLRRQRREHPWWALGFPPQALRDASWTRAAASL
ncbi:MAG: hypothetical protein KatS3mg102_1143 [Planctomycetota bacterium]|nr:MAG: hypothetical protein KatS3mg102_1143 [Planctomycetota bacterium]